MSLTVLLCAAGGGIAFAQAPGQPAQQPRPPAESNPFPADTNSVPVVPTTISPVAPESNAAPVPTSGSDDPVRSPDDPVGNPDSEGASGFSSSSAGIDKLIPPPDAETKGHRGGKNQSAPAEHQETAKEDEDVGGLYLSQKNWRAAASRFQSAVVLDPENPDVYWGLAESERHLAQFAAAKANYQKVIDYDPGSKHAREAKKLLGEPELATAATNR